jgi:hypothetical protein
VTLRPHVDHRVDARTDHRLIVGIRGGGKRSVRDLSDATDWLKALNASD